jgi:hypothetical protein
VSTEASLRDHPHRVAAPTVHLCEKRHAIEAKKSLLRQRNSPLPQARFHGGVGSEVSMSTGVLLRNYLHRVAAITVHLCDIRYAIEAKKSLLRQRNPPLTQARAPVGACIRASRPICAAGEGHSATTRTASSAAPPRASSQTLDEICCLFVLIFYHRGGAQKSKKREEGKLDHQIRPIFL